MFLCGVSSLFIFLLLKIGSMEECHGKFFLIFSSYGINSRYGYAIFMLVPIIEMYNLIQSYK